MIHTTKTVHKLLICKADYEALERVINMMASLLTDMGEDATLMATNTGEMIEMEELPRMMGILSCIKDIDLWEEVN